MTVPIRPPKDDSRLDSGRRLDEIYRWCFEVYRRLKDTSLLTFSVSYTSVSSNTTLSSAITKVTAACTLTVPTAVGVGGHSYHVDNAHSGSTVLSPTGSETIEGETSQTLTGFCCITIYSDGTNWRIM